MQSVTKVLRLWLQNPFSLFYTQPMCTRSILAALAGSVARVSGKRRSALTCVGGVRATFLATSHLAPEVCLRRTGA